MAMRKIDLITINTNNTSIEVAPPPNVFVDKINEMVDVFNRFEKKPIPKLDSRDRKLLNGILEAFSNVGEQLVELSARITELEDTVYNEEE